MRHIFFINAATVILYRNQQGGILFLMLCTDILITPCISTASAALRMMFKNASVIIDASTVTRGTSSLSICTSIRLFRNFFFGQGQNLFDNFGYFHGAILGSTGLAKTRTLFTSSSRCSTSFSAILNLLRSLQPD